MSDKKYGKKAYREALSESDRQLIDSMLPFIHKGVAVAEGNPNLGVLSVKTDDPATVLDNSIVNNFYRWRKAGSPGKMIDFMQKRWAPLGAENDPKDLNKNWAPNVRATIKKKYPQQYEKMKDLNMVMNLIPQAAGEEYRSMT